MDWRAFGVGINRFITDKIENCIIGPSVRAFALDPKVVSSIPGLRLSFVNFVNNFSDY